MTDKTHAHNLTTQILAAYAQSGKIMLFEKGVGLGTFFGEAYQELFKRIAQG